MVYSRLDVSLLQECPYALLDLHLRGVRAHANDWYAICGDVCLRLVRKMLARAISLYDKAILPVLILLIQQLTKLFEGLNVHIGFEILVDDLDIRSSKGVGCTNDS